MPHAQQPSIDRILLVKTMLQMAREECESPPIPLIVSRRAKC